MIYGIGIDMVETADLAKRMEHSHFHNIFGRRERAYADEHPMKRAEILAARWATKEAFGKALGTGLRADWSVAEIELVQDAAGRPILELSPFFAQLLPPGAKVHCSVSHTHGYACATVIIETA